MSEAGTPASFRPIARNVHLPARIAEEIAGGIADGRFKAGDKLPTEHVFAGLFGVSRSVVREAIAQLRNEGMVETRQGVGAFVTDPQRRATIRIDATDLSNRARLRDFFQLRIPLEIEAARLAALYRTGADIAALEQALARMGAAPDWSTQGVAADLDFHRAIAAATQNAFFPIFLGFVAEKISASANSTFPRDMGPPVVALTIEEHAAIHRAVRERNAQGAARAMDAHLSAAAARLSITLERP